MVERTARQQLLAITERLKRTRLIAGFSNQDVDVVVIELIDRFESADYLSDESARDFILRSIRDARASVEQASYGLSQFEFHAKRVNHPSAIPVDDSKVTIGGWSGHVVEKRTALPASKLVEGVKSFASRLHVPVEEDDGA